jgi:hypothetical protein
MLLRFPFATNPDTGAFLAIITLLLLGFGILAVKITKGYVSNYLRKDIPNRLKTVMFYFQGIASVLFALILPNNYLVRIDFFRKLYKQQELWIGFSMLVLLLSAIILIGLLFSFVTRKRKVRNDFLREERK